MSNEIRLLQAEVMRLTLQVEQLGGDDEAIIELQKQLIILQSRLIELSGTVANLNSEVYELTGEVASVEAETTLIKQNVTKNTNALIAHTQEIQRNVYDIEDANTRITTLEQKEDNRAHYLGAFLITAELQAVTASPNDYADNYQTNTRWVYQNNAWNDTKRAIPSNSAQVSDIVPTKVNISTLPSTGSAGVSPYAARADHKHAVDTVLDVDFLSTIKNNGGVIPVGRGGTGMTDYTPYGVIMGGEHHGDPLISLPLGGAGMALVSNGVDVLPSWKSIPQSPTIAVITVLIPPVSQGYTGVTFSIICPTTKTASTFSYEDLWQLVKKDNVDIEPIYRLYPAAGAGVNYDGSVVTSSPIIGIARYKNDMIAAITQYGDPVPIMRSSPFELLHFQTFVGMLT